jgi:putative phage-type endonuclease
MKVVNLNQGTQEWHDWRLAGLGSSESPVIMGISPYKTAHRLFKERRGLVKEDNADRSYIFAQGHKYESIIRTECEKLIGCEMRPLCGEHEEFSYLHASLDGFDVSRGILEAKLVGKEVLKSAKKGEIPEHHNCQMQKQMFVTGIDEGLWFGMDFDRNGVVVPVKADKKYSSVLIEKEHLFWQNLCDNKAPELSEDDYFTPDDISKLADLRELKELIANAQIQSDALEQEIIEAYKHPRIMGAGIKLYKACRSGSLTLTKVPEIAKAIEEIKASLDPKYLENFRGKSTEYWTVKVV